jgi:co-chaperonin GroES (HSP10)
MRVKLITKRLLVEEIEIPCRNPKLILPEKVEIKSMIKYWKKHPFQGKVLAIGSDIVDIKVGDKVYLKNHLSKAQPILIEEKIYYQIYEQDVALIIPKNEKDGTQV